MGSSALTILQPQAHHLLCFCDLLSHFSCHCIAKRTKNKTKNEASFGPYFNFGFLLLIPIRNVLYKVKLE